MLRHMGPVVENGSLRPPRLEALAVDQAAGRGLSARHTRRALFGAVLGVLGVGVARPVCLREPEAGSG